MSEPVIAVLTYKSVQTILDVGGTQSWVLDKNRAKRCTYAVVYRNAHHERTEGAEKHGAPFMIGKIKDVVPSTDHQGRWLITFSEYAVGNYKDEWEGRNPVAYYTTDNFDEIDFDTLHFRPMPDPVQAEDQGSGDGITICEAKARLALGLGVPASAIEICVRI